MTQKIELCSVFSTTSFWIKMTKLLSKQHLSSLEIKMNSKMKVNQDDGFRSKCPHGGETTPLLIAGSAGLGRKQLYSSAM
jgi:hypothetical protein